MSSPSPAGVSRPHILFVTGTRADYGKIKAIMRAVRDRPEDFEYSIFVTGMHLLKKYGIRVEEYDILLAAQGGTCATCDATTGSSHREVLSVDHHHTTGEVRGLLCMRCNTAIGLIGDDPRRAERIAEYLGGS